MKEEMEGLVERTRNALDKVADLTEEQKAVRKLLVRLRAALAKLEVGG